ncbi:hypothetical protein HK098_006391 [Nowakowskiella sp. JEL0407]|nr:hypothetical protein HK098_006391 [Nowakowskiella sp. JEL0407]
MIQIQPPSLRHQILLSTSQSVSQKQFKYSLNYISKSDYKEVLSERKLEGYCALPTCENSTEKNKNLKKFAIKNSKLFDTSVRVLFCSDECFLSSTLVEECLDVFPKFTVEKENSIVTIFEENLVNSHVDELLSKVKDGNEKAKFELKIVENDIRDGDVGDVKFEAASVEGHIPNEKIFKKEKNARKGKKKVSFSKSTKPPANDTPSLDKISYKKKLFDTDTPHPPQNPLSNIVVESFPAPPVATEDEPKAVATEEPTGEANTQIAEDEQDILKPSFSKNDRMEVTQFGKLFLLLRVLTTEETCGFIKNGEEYVRSVERDEVQITRRNIFSAKILKVCAKLKKDHRLEPPILPVIDFIKTMWFNEKIVVLDKKEELAVSVVFLKAINHHLLPPILEAKWNTLYNAVGMDVYQVNALVDVLKEL